MDIEAGKRQARIKMETFMSRERVFALKKCHKEMMAEIQRLFPDDSALQEHYKALDEEFDKVFICEAKFQVEISEKTRQQP